MPNYNFRCDKCDQNISLFLSIKEFREEKDINKKCNSCGEGKLYRVYQNILTHVDRQSEDMIESIKEEARKIVEKVKSGDSSALSEIYGDEVNKLKFK
jgi:putative FmdB family regulatory protein